MLAIRAQSISQPFVLLLHALSGGIPRDLIRYARRLMEVHPWTVEGGPLLNRLYVIVRLLHGPEERNELETRIRIGNLADNPIPRLSRTAGDGESAFGDATVAL